MKKTLLFVALSAALFSCRKDPDFGDLSSNLVTYTNYDTKADFSSYTTYYVSDTIMKLGVQNGTKLEDSIIIDNNSKSIADEIRKKMNSSGYTATTDKNTADLVFAVGVTKELNVVVNYIPSWWDPYWDWYFPYYYPYYYPWATSYAYTTGSLIINTVDRKNANTSKKYNVIWNITGMGALSNNQNDLTRALNCIDQGFAQSPYVKK